MSTAAPAEAVLNIQSLLCQALADPKRLRILYRLASGDTSVGDLAEDIGAPISNVSQHLAILRARGLVTSRREGNSIVYGLAYPEIMEACKILRGVISRQLADSSSLALLIGGDERLE